MNIQIFGTKKSKDSQKAERFFKERGIKFQYVDMKIKGLSKGEFESVRKAVGGLEAMIDRNCKDKDLLALITYIAEEDRAEKLLENQSVLLLPIVRNGKQATVGYQPDDVYTERKRGNLNFSRRLIIAGKYSENKEFSHR